MKNKAVVLSLLAGLIVLAIGYESSRATSKKSEDAKIGVLSIRKIFEECKRNAKYREQARAEQKRIIAELEKLSKEIEADKAGLKTLKAGSSDYLAQMKELLSKQAGFEAQQEFYKQQLDMQDQRWMEELYNDILRITAEVARQRGLDLVLERSEPELPAASVNELMLAIRTYKLLYSGGCMDISDEVIERLDQEK